MTKTINTFFCCTVMGTDDGIIIVSFGADIDSGAALASLASNRFNMFYIIYLLKLFHIVYHDSFVILNVIVEIVQKSLDDEVTFVIFVLILDSLYLILFIILTRKSFST